MIIEGNDISEFKQSTSLDESKGNCFIILAESRNLEIECRTKEEAGKIVLELY